MLGCMATSWRMSSEEVYCLSHRHCPRLRGKSAQPKRKLKRNIYCVRPWKLRLFFRLLCKAPLPRPRIVWDNIADAPLWLNLPTGTLDLNSLGHCSLAPLPADLIWVKHILVDFGLWHSGVTCHVRYTAPFTESCQLHCNCSRPAFAPPWRLAPLCTKPCDRQNDCSTVVPVAELMLRPILSAASRLGIL